MLRDFLNSAGLAAGLAVVATSPAAPSSIAKGSDARPDQTAAAASMTARTKAVEITVERAQTVATIGNRRARPGYEFVIVSTAWKNVLPQGLGQTTTYRVPSLDEHVWLVTDGRYIDGVDLQAQESTPGHLADGFSVKPAETVRGTIVFEAMAGARFRALALLDATYGHAQVAVSGVKPVLPAPIGAPRENAVVQLLVSEAGFGPAGRPAPSGRRYFTVALRGTSKSSSDIVRLPLADIVYLQTDRGCVAKPDLSVTPLTRPFGETALFVPAVPNEGQIAFLVPDDTKSARVLITPSGEASLALPAGPDFAPSWPTPVATINDGTTLKLLVLPAAPKPATLPAAPAGRQYVLLDLVAQNLKSDQGIELDGRQAIRLVDAGGRFIAPSPISDQLPCSLGEIGVVPPGNARRFQLLYDIPAGATPSKVEYRGFERDSVIVDIKR